MTTNKHVYQELTDSSFVYVVRDDGMAELIRYTGSDDEVLIPNELGGRPVASVLENPFYDDHWPAKAYTVTVRQDHPYFAVIDGVLFGKSDRKLIYYSPALKAAEYAIPDGTLEIGDCAFHGCTGLTSVAIPGTVNSIGWGAFSGCTGLTSVTIPNGVVSIWGHAFEDCESLTSVTVPDSVTGIGADAFMNCISLEEIDVSSGNPFFAGVDGVLYKKDLSAVICDPARLRNTPDLYEELDSVIQDYANDDTDMASEWYDWAVDICEKIVRMFTDEDWNKLFSDIASKSNKWKYRFIDCLNPDDKRSLKLLLLISKTDDLPLLENIVAYLPYYDPDRTADMDELIARLRGLRKNQ